MALQVENVISTKFEISIKCCVRLNHLMMADSENGLASGRERRSNAGARMSRLLDAEDDDDFYKTTYGGFTEVNVAAT